MSNDTKFWAVRLLVFFCIAFDVGILLKAVSALIGGKPSSSTILFVLFFSVACVGMAISVYYYKLKAQRWDSSFSQEQTDKIALETLAQLGKQKESRNDR